MRSTKHLELVGLALLLGAAGAADADDGKKELFPNIAPIAQYRMASRSEEIAMARSAAPASISSEAEVLILGDRGYESAAKGKNGFVCLVERSWFSSFGDDEFWNPKIRGPICLNPPAVSSVLPADLEKTRWVLSGSTKTEMIAKTQSLAGTHQLPAAGSMGYMLSKEGYLSQAGGHWHPHLMFFQPPTALSAWGANLPGSPVKGAQGEPGENTVFFVILSAWSDGTAASI